MRYPYPKLSVPGIFVLSATLVIVLSLSFHSCRKTDFGQNDSTREESFFRTTSKDPNVLRLIASLKAQNERTHFVNKLPKNSGRPIWDKYVIRSKKIDKSIFWRGGEPDSVAVIPFTSNNENLSAIIVYDSSTVSPALNCYTTNGNLYAVCHNANVDIDKAEQMLAIFLQMENRVFGTTVFYHIPAKIFKNPALPDTATVEKQLSIDTVTVQGFAADDCFVIKYCNPGGVCTPPTYCDNCSVCPWIYYCDTPPPGDGGGGGGSGEPPTTPTEPPTGGGGGGGTPPPPSEPCPFGGAWYNFVPSHEPCDPVPPPPVPPTYDPSEAIRIEIDSSITNNFPCLDTLLQNLPNANRVAQELLHNVFGVNIYSNLTFQIDWSLNGTSLTNAYTTPGGSYSYQGYFRFFDTIRINPWVVQNASKEYLVGVIMHEAVHAYIRHRYGQWVLGYISAQTFISEFPLFWPNYTNPLNTTELMEHEQLAASYIGDIEDIVKLYFNPLAPPALKNRVSNNIAWEGLRDASVWKFPGLDTCRIIYENKAARNTSIVHHVGAYGVCPPATVRYDSLGLSLPCN